MRWGSWGANFSDREIAELIQFCVDEDLTSFDHADIYGGYSTERLFGNGFKLSDVEREKVQFITKCGIELPGGEKPISIKFYDLSKDYILKQVEESLSKLQTDYIDLLLLHRPSPLMNPEEIAAAFGILRNNGKVLNFGVSNFSVSQFNLISSCFPYLLTNQVEISANETKAFYDGTLDQMMMKKLRPMAWSVMGNYFSDKQSTQNVRLKSILQPLCSKYNVEENQLLLTFILKHPSRILPVVGTSKKATLKQFKDALKINLKREDWFKILEASLGKEVD